jgi:hypothetical protein
MTTTIQSTFTRQYSLDRRSWIIISLLIIIVIIGAVLRLQSVLHTRIIRHVIRFADTRDYMLYAYNLTNFGVYSRSDAGLMSSVAGAGAPHPAPDAVRSPGYPLFLSLFAGLRPVPPIYALAAGADCGPAHRAEPPSCHRHRLPAD